MSPRPRVPQRIVIIAGPNGAGKTTFATEFLPNEAGCPDFINADLIARGLSPFASESVAFEAGKVMLSQMAARVKAGRSFAFETTLSGLGYARSIPLWRRAGYHVKMIFLSLPSVGLALERIRIRVKQGGHDVPEGIVRRRFGRGFRNFEKVYRGLVNAWALYDNSGSLPILISSGDND
ncbi:MAG TPA: AAA family ATPase [Candidatus Methylomirabilis sp.]|nr:AAA family ATPase [Candidatus Methylomirabilis sp.]